MLGLDQVVAINVGAAPTPVEVLEFFHAIGLPLAELWGMSETCGAGTCQPARARSRSAPSARRRPASRSSSTHDGEVLIRVRRRDAAATATCPTRPPRRSTDDGWLRTGDIGEIDDDGYLKIVDRKKELIINAAGKNMSPANIEATLKTASPLIGQAAVHRRRHALQHGADRARRRLRARRGPRRTGIEDTSLEELAGEDAIRAAVQTGRRRGQRQARPRRADQEVHDRRGRLAARRRRADADDEAQAQADRREVRRRDRGLYAG